jgi:UDP-N-acetylmuramyl pentapeptide phosphotransferase/UDP-N-acetylglucosamine-1-phosphate transferase
MLYLIGLLDDWKQLQPKHRLFAQIAIAIGYIATQTPQISQTLSVTQLSTFLQPIILLLSILFVMGSINAANFMDGIDWGLLANLVPGFSLFILLLFNIEQTHPLALVLTTVFGALMAFAILNRPPAKIYMGDSGSLVLGFLVGAIGLYFLTYHQTIAGILPFSYLFCDTFLTLINRIKKRENFLNSHSGHAYQIARSDLSHLSIAYRIGAVSLFCCLMSFMTFIWANTILIQAVAFVASALASLALFFHFSRIMPKVSNS